LIPEAKLYREIFSLRVEMSTVVLRPNLVFNWNYEYPILAPDYDPGFEYLVITEPGDPANSTWDDITVTEINPRMDLYQEDAVLSGWIFEYPDISLFSPLLRSSILAIKIIIEYVLFLLITSHCP